MTTIKETKIRAVTKGVLEEKKTNKYLPWGENYINYGTKNRVKGKL